MEYCFEFGGVDIYCVGGVGVGEVCVVDLVD